MKALFSVMFLMFSGLVVFAQVTEQDSIMHDSIAFNMQLQEIVISNVKDSVSPEERKLIALLRRRVLKVYPYAKVAAERLLIFKQNMAKLKTDKEKRKYSKMVENYMQNEFEGQLKKLSRKEGQILVKLIYRQTGESAFDLIKEHKSGWKAFWSNRVAKLFNIDLKKGYSPGSVAEDFLIEGFLLKAFDERRLQRQEPAFTIDYASLKKTWKEKSKNEKSEG